MPAVTARLSVMMFLQFFIWGSWYATVGAYMNEHGMVDLIAWAYSVGPIAAIAAPLFLGLIADRFFATERVLGAMQVLAGATMFIAANVTGTPLIWVLLLHMLFFMPTLGLTNTLAFHHIVNQEKTFPIIRVFGTLGWIVAGLMISLVFSFDTSANQFYVTGVAAIVMGIYSFTLPHTPPPARGQKVTAASALGLDALPLLKDRNFLVFIVASMLICIPLAAYYGFTGPFLLASDAFRPDEGTANVAFYLSFGQMSEVLFMLLMPLFFVRLGVKWMLLVGMGAWVLRYGLFAGAGTGPETAAFLLIIGGIVLHGICYDFFFVTGQIYTDQKSGPKIRGQAQGLLVVMTQGVGLLIGAQIAGYLRRSNSVINEAGEIVSTDWRMFWLIPCIMALVVMIGFFLLFRGRRPEEQQNVDAADVSEAHAEGGFTAPTTPTTSDSAI